MKDWGALLDQNESGVPLALVRILMALTILHFLIDSVVTGVVPLIWMNPEDGGYRAVKEAQWLIALLGGANPATVWGLIGAATILGVLFLLGVGGFVVPLALLQVLMGLFSLNSQTGGGHDRVITCALFLMVFARHSATLSLTAKVRTGQWMPPSAVPAWPRWLLFYQLCLIYTSTGLQKIGAEWMPWGGFSAIYYSLQLPHWARADHAWATTSGGYLVTQVGTAVTWVFEATAMLWFYSSWVAETGGARLGRWCRRFQIREAYALVGVLLHLGIAVTMNVGPFSAAMVSLYPTAWRLKPAWRPGARGSTGATPPADHQPTVL